MSNFMIQKQFISQKKCLKSLCLLSLGNVFLNMMSIREALNKTKKNLDPPPSGDELKYFFSRFLEEISKNMFFPHHGPLKESPIEFVNLIYV